MTYFLYNLLLFLASPFYILRVLWKNGGGKERFGIYTLYQSKLGTGQALNQNKKVIWIHAVSVGEVLSLQKLVAEIKDRHPEWKVYFSTLTHSGYKIALNKLHDADKIFFVPLDFKPIVRKFFKVLKPDLFILAESEFWPNLLREAKDRTRGVLLINGRISPRSRRRASGATA